MTKHHNPKHQRSRVLFHHPTMPQPEKEKKDDRPKIMPNLGMWWNPFRRG